MTTIMDMRRVHERRSHDTTGYDGPGVGASPTASHERDLPSREKLVDTTDSHRTARIQLIHVRRASLMDRLPRAIDATYEQICALHDSAVLLHLDNDPFVPGHRHLNLGSHGDHHMIALTAPVDIWACAVGIWQVEADYAAVYATTSEVQVRNVIWWVVI